MLVITDGGGLSDPRQLDDALTNAQDQAVTVRVIVVGGRCGSLPARLRTTCTAAPGGAFPGTLDRLLTELRAPSPLH